MLKYILWVFIFITNFYSVVAYDMSMWDMQLVTKLEKRLFTILDTREEKIVLKLLDRIDAIQWERTNKRINAILEKLETDIEKRYEIELFVRATVGTPVLYTPDFKTQFGWDDGVTLNFDRYGEIDAVEFIALPWTVFQLKWRWDNDIYTVTTKDYPVPRDLYIHKSFVWEISRW